jgi:hypothetical protein
VLQRSAFSPMKHRGSGEFGLSQGA